MLTDLCLLFFPSGVLNCWRFREESNEPHLLLEAEEKKFVLLRILGRRSARPKPRKNIVYKQIKKLGEALFNPLIVFLKRIHELHFTVKIHRLLHSNSHHQHESKKKEGPRPFLSFVSFLSFLSFPRM